MNSKDEKKKEKKKRGKEKKLEKGNTEVQVEPKKSDLLSKLDKLDSVSKEEILATEEKLKSGLIKSEREAEVKKVIEDKINVSEIKNQIEKLKERKQEYSDKGQYNEVIEITKKIISIANANNLKYIVTEEEKSIELLQNETTKKAETLICEQKIEDLKKIQYLHYSKEEYEEAIQIAIEIIALARQTSLNSVIQEEEKFVNVIQEKLNLKSSNIVFSEPLESLRAVNLKQKVLDISEINKIPELEKLENEEKDKIEAEKLKLEQEKEKLKKERQKFEEEKENFERVRQEFEEEKEKFNREKQEFKGK